MNKIIDDSNLKEKILDVTLPLEIVYKEQPGESVSTQLRHGRIDTIFRNNKDINTRYGQQTIQPRIKLYFRAFTNENSVLTIDIINTIDNNLFKKFIIKSLNNCFTIDDMKNISDEIITLLKSENTSIATNLIDYIRNKENLIFEEIAQ